MSDINDIANRPTRMLEAGLLFGIAIDAIRAIKVEPRTGGQTICSCQRGLSVIGIRTVQDWGRMRIVQEQYPLFDCLSTAI